MNKDRRKFLKLSTVAAAGFMLPLYSCGPGSGNEAANNQQKGAKVAGANNTLVDQFGIQLYTLKEEMAKDPKGVLKHLASVGYKQVESFEGAQGMFWGMKPTEFRDYIESLGMTLVSSHVNIYENFEEKAAQAAEAGMKYLICPWVGPQESIEDFRKIANDFNKAGEICKQHNLRFAYHNHAYSFEELEGQLPQKVMMDNTDPELVWYEMDIYWVVMGGADPQQWLKDYPNRWTLCHVKDRRKDATAEETHASTMVGQGSIDYVPIIKTAKEVGMEYFIVEQEEFIEHPPKEAVKISAEYLNKLEG